MSVGDWDSFGKYILGQQKSGKTLFYVSIPNFTYLFKINVSSGLTIKSKDSKVSKFQVIVNSFFFYSRTNLLHGDLIINFH